MSIHYYEIADLIIKLDIDDAIIPTAMQDFEIEPVKSKDAVCISFVNKPYKSVPGGVATVEDIRLAIYAGRHEFIVKYKNAKAVDCYVNDCKKPETRVYLCEDVVSQELTDRECMDEIMCTIRDAFMFHMQKQGRIAIHSASIVYRDEVWAFAAKSGVGKSTHVNLWHEAGYPATDFNGDLIIAYVKDNIPIAAGSPWCGTSGLYVNNKIRLGGIVFLKRDFYNHVRMYTASETISKMLARSLTPNWTRSQFDKNVEIASELEKLTLCGVLECLPDAGAADLARRYIDDLYVYRSLRKKS